MPTLQLPDGSTVDASDQDLATGKYGAPTAPVLMLDDKGVPTHVDPESVSDAIAQGYKTTTPEEANRAKELAEAATHPVEAGALGFASGVVPGAPKAIEALGGPDLQRQADIAAGSPTAHAAGLIGGNVAQLAAVGALTGGLGDVAEGAAAGGRALEAAGEAGAGLAEAAAPQAAAAGASSIFDGAKMAKAAAEFGAQSAGNEVNEELLGPDHQLHGEAIATQAGLGALLGGASEPIFGAVKAVVPKAIGVAGDAVTKATDTLAKVMGGGSEAAANVYDAASSGVRDAAGKLSRDAAEGLATSLNDTVKAAGDLVKETSENIRPAEVKNVSALHPVSAARAGVDEYITKNLYPAMEALKTGAEAGEFAPNIVSKMQKAVSAFEDAYEDATETHQVYDAVKGLRQEIDPIMGYAKRLGASTPEVDAIRTIEQSVQSPLRGVLNDAATFGEAGAAANQAYNKAFSELKTAGAALFSKLGVKDLLADGRPKSVISPSKIAAFLSGGDKIGQQQARDVYENYLQKVQAFSDMAKDSADAGGKTLDQGRLQDLLSNIAKERNEGASAAALARGTSGGAWAGGVSSDVAAGLAGTLGHMTGIPGAGIAAAAAVKGIKAMRDPAGTLQALGTIKNLVTKHQSQIVKGAADFLSGKAAAGAKGLGSVGAADLLEKGSNFAAGRSGKTMASSYDKRVDEIQNLMARPTLTQNALASNTSGMAEAAPMATMAAHQAALARLNTIAAAIPKDPNPGMLQTKYVPTPDEVDHFQRVYQVVDHPVKATYAALNEGTLTQDMVDALQSSSPATLDQMRQAIQNEIVDNPKREYSYAQKFGMSMILGQPISPEVSPAQIAWQQQTFAAATPPPQGNGSTAKPKGTRVSGLDKLSVAQSTALPGQARNMERNS